ncbi:MAG: DUF1178 family protein [Rhizobiaceae bacterium]|nr:DUF1178 family protein [Rhizobiaceae bacterium]
MIKFSLVCERDHEFDGWFRNSDDFDTQKKRGFVACPVCNSAKVDKALMAPAVSTGKKKEKIALAVGEEQKKMLQQFHELGRKLREGAENVGDKFADEARKIHFGETEARGIYGEASPDEVKGLLDDGVEFMPLPPLPEERN